MNVTKVKNRMESEIYVRERIDKILRDYAHIINQKGAVIQVNAPVALQQVGIKCRLDELYNVLGEKCPNFPMDDFSEKKIVT
jgi:hypothetical protein